MNRKTAYIRPELKCASVLDLFLLCLSDLESSAGTEDIVLDSEKDWGVW